MQLSIFGSNTSAAAPGWKRETVVALLGSARLDFTAAPPADGARLTAVTVLGSTRISVATGTKVSVSGASVFGSRKVEVEQGAGPALQMVVWSFLGSTRVDNG